MAHEKAVITNRERASLRYDIVGSFLRPAPLKAARAAHAEGRIDDAELEGVENEAIARLVEQERAAGLRAVTDGEFRRSYWHLDFFWGFEGIDHVQMDRGYLFHGVETRADSARVSGKIRFEGHPFLGHYRYLREVAGQDVVARQTIPAPAQLLAELVRGVNREALDRIYPDREELHRDIAQAYRAAIRGFYDLGCRNLQLDDCTWGMLCDARFRETAARNGTDFGMLQETYLNLNNEAISGLPEDLVLTTHVCRGNYRSTWAASGGYEPVAEALLGRSAVSAFYLEYDTERAGGFEPLALVPSNKQIVLGLVSSKQAELENPEAVANRIREAAQMVPLDRLCLSTQCGFASTEEGNLLTEERQWEKIALVREVAESVWG
jgi:methionine synthase II (cobalamin-independent)